MATNKAIQITRFNQDLSGLDLIERQIPTAKEGEVVIEIKLRPVNPTDILELSGAYSEAIQPPVINGSEGVGIVASDGKRFKKGQREGTWQQFVAVQEDHLVAVPDAVSDEIAAQFFINPLTVYGMFEVMQIPEGKCVLQTAAGSTLGRMVIALAKKRGIKTINVVRRSEQKDELLQIGADYVIGSDKEDIPARVKEITGGDGAYAALECIGGPISAQVVKGLRPGGTLYAYGSMSGEHFEAGFFDLVVFGKTISRFMIFNWIGTFSREELAPKLEEVWQLLQDGTFTPPPGTTFPLEKFKAAIEETQKVGRGGKAFLSS